MITVFICFGFYFSSSSNGSIGCNITVLTNSLEVGTWQHPDDQTAFNAQVTETGKQKQIVK